MKECNDDNSHENGFIKSVRGKRRRNEDISNHIINLSYIDSENLAHAFNNAIPFRHLCIDNVLKKDICDELENQLLQQTFAVKENDLFSFLQTADLTIADSDSYLLVHDVVGALYSQPFREVLANATGVHDLTSKVDLTCSIYSHTQHLLCHDDKLSSRRLAFILYLVDDSWSEKCGGTLDLFTVNKNKEPNGIFKRLVPKRNRLIVFEVCDISFHQVAEVLTKDKMRLSIGGWFHGSSKATLAKDWKPLEPKFSPVETLPPLVLSKPQNLSNGALDDWINPTYMTESTQSAINNYFKDQPYIQLHDFLKQDMYDKVIAWLRNEGNTEWRRVGPYEKQHLDIIETKPLKYEAKNECLGYCLRDLFQSSEMANLLSKLTNLSIEKCSSQIRRFLPSCYTLSYDSGISVHEVRRSELDLLLTIVDNNDCWEDETGGQDDESMAAPGGQSV